MRFRARTAEDVEINITSLIDVVLLLLIFFMVSTRFIDESKLDLTLPSASAERVGKLPDAIDVTIDKRGQVFVDGQALVNARPETIEAALREARGKHPDPVVVISADRDARFQLAIDAMDAAQQVGLTRITFPTNVREPE